MRFARRGIIAGIIGLCLAAAPVRGAQSPADFPPALHISGGEIDIDLRGKPEGASQEQLLSWIRTAAKAVSTYYGRYPVKRVRIEISADADGHDINGRTFDGRFIRMTLGPGVDAADLKDDWVLTHEMLHLAFPDMGEKHLWMNEGLSTYAEPMARAAIGTLSPAYVWKETVEGVPRGQPLAGDHGLDRTHTWGRTYWGGCLFWLLADVRIRQQTGQKRCLQDALRAIVDAGGDGSAEWSVARVLNVGDKATGTTVLKDLYAQMAPKAMTVDLDALWKELGVLYQDGAASFDDAAPLAAIRRAMTQVKK